MLIITCDSLCWGCPHKRNNSNNKLCLWIVSNYAVWSSKVIEVWRWCINLMCSYKLTLFFFATTIISTKPWLQRKPLFLFLLVLQNWLFVMDMFIWKTALSWRSHASFLKAIACSLFHRLKFREVPPPRPVNHHWTHFKEKRRRKVKSESQFNR